MIRRGRESVRSPWLGLVLTVAVAQATMFVRASHADEPGASDSAALAAGQEAPPPPRTYGLPRRVGWNWDLEVDLGLRLAERDIDASLGMARVQAGALWADEPLYYSLGLTAEIGGSAGRGLGGQATVTHLFTGTWAHLGASWLPRDSAAMTSLGVGWSLFGLEWQHRFDDGQSDALLFHLRLPLGTTWFLFTRKPVASTRP
jgi:hypothetical protein